MTKKIQGTIIITSVGAGYVSSEGIDEDVYILPSLLNTALNGDEVEIITHAKVEGERTTGEVVRVISRKKTRFVGTVNVEKGGKFAFLTADDFKMYVSIFIPKIPFNLKSNTKVLVEMISWTDIKRSPTGKILKIIGKKGDNRVEMESIVIERGFDIEFLNNVKEEAKNIKNKSQESLRNELKSRVDFRDVLTFTIDSEDAKDFDDAISFKKLSEDSYEIGIHIADVSHWITTESSIDKEARKRGTSIYLVDRTIPMLPEILSNDLCSLNCNEDKLTFSAVFTILKNGDIKNVWFGKTITKSNYRYTYDLVQEIIDGKNDPCSSELRELMEITRNLRKKRIANGALEIGHNEVNIILDKDGKPIRIYLKEGIDSQKLIEELMVLANKEVALYLGEKDSKGLCIFRVSERPKQEEINEIFIFLEKLGYNVRINEKNASSNDINNLLKKMRGRDEEFLVKTTVIRSLSRAIYSVINKGHFAMALQHYAHFTSPIRRYADLLVHRALQKKLMGKIPTEKEKVFYKETAEYLSEREFDSSSAERISIAFKQVEYMLERVGEIKNGIISKVASWGIYIQEIETRTEGMVRLKDMKDDFYVFDKETFSMTGQKTKKRYLLGDRVKVKIAGGDLERKIINYTFV